MIEDWCFVCKDGGDLILCEHANCSKVYHLQCVGFDSQTTSENIQQNWTCDCHICGLCKGAAEFHCFCCPTSYCPDCIKSVNFALLQPNQGLCPECWALARLAEKLSFSKQYVDFEDRDTEECLFKEYWDIVKEEQGFSRQDLVMAANELNGKKKITKGSTRTLMPTPTPTPTPSNDWGSKPLVHFLTSIGVDTTTSEQLTQRNVASIILKYAQERDLIHPTKNTRIICDKNLHLIFKKNTISMKQIYPLLDPHCGFNGNKRPREKGRRDSAASSSSDHDDDEDDASACYKQQKTRSSSSASEDQECPPKEKEKSFLASVVPHNINLIYLRRSVVEELLKHPESFEDKVVGSFVKVINTSSTQGKNSQHLLQITAVKKMPTSDDSSVSLHNWALPDIQISMLSDSHVTEEDCRDLREKIARGLFQRPTVDDIEKKARILHQDIRNDWIEKELVNLQNLIDRANEKGRRKELNQLIDRRQALKKEAEQQSLELQQLPTIIVDSSEEDDVNPSSR